MERALCADNGVKGYPTVKFFYGKKDGALKYSSARTIEALKTFVEEQVAKEVGFLVGTVNPVLSDQKTRQNLAF